MTVLVIGGAASGKSAFAEDLLTRLPGEGERIYLATMEPSGPEAAARIERHRRLRAGQGFRTVECPVRLAAAPVPAGRNVLLEDLGNLCANELYSPAGCGDRAEEAVWQGVEHLQRICRHLVIVSNEVFSGGTAYQGDTERYLRLLGRLHQRIAAAADGVCEVACGVPCWIKGAEPHAHSERRLPRSAACRGDLGGGAVCVF